MPVINAHWPKIEEGIDIRGPKIPGIGIDIKGPKIGGDIRGPRY